MRSAGLYDRIVARECLCCAFRLRSLVSIIGSAQSAWICKYSTLTPLFAG